ncbi:acyl-CoA dehydratase activase [Thermobrachium celere]|uniref:acyl-CoA dehydratase activase n=1 Tax=Thermobrachium celere TaxID=53422 RepID=UPI0019438FB0|nr:acyl-CoA dehydratase activase [Thermobrachium celere]GFR35724.1 CoA activase [Thermobrachium celere]
MIGIGIDIGSTAAKMSIYYKDKNKFEHIIMPTGWNCKDTALNIKNRINELGINNAKIVATGYGRVSVPYADKTLTEITCHAKGSLYLLGKDTTVIDIGGQDTKVITIRNGKVVNFIMNDKCAAGTGRFLELMSNSMGITINELCEIGKNDTNIKISSMCTVFAESEIISLIAEGTPKEDICSSIIDAIVSKVSSLVSKCEIDSNYFLTGGLSKNNVILQRLSNKLKKPIYTHKDAVFAGSIGAALIACE